MSLSLSRSPSLSFLPSLSLFPPPPLSPWHIFSWLWLLTAGWSQDSGTSFLVTGFSQRCPWKFQSITSAILYYQAKPVNEERNWWRYLRTSCKYSCHLPKTKLSRSSPTALPHLSLNVTVSKWLSLIPLCDSVIYNKKYILGFYTLSATELLKPLEFPEERDQGAFCYVKEVIFWTHRRRRAGARTAQQVGDWGLEFSLPSPWLPGSGKWLRLNESLIANEFYQSCFCGEASIKTQKDGVQRASRLVTMWRLRDGNGVQRAEKPWALSSYLVLSISFIWPFLSYIPS